MPECKDYGNSTSKRGAKIDSKKKMDRIGTLVREFFDDDFVILPEKRNPFVFLPVCAQLRQFLVHEYFSIALCFQSLNNFKLNTPIQRFIHSKSYLNCNQRNLFVLAYIPGPPTGPRFYNGMLKTFSILLRIRKYSQSHQYIST